MLTRARVPGCPALEPHRCTIADADVSGTAYPPDVAFEDGTVAVVLVLRRERPKLAVDEEGRPVALINGVNYVWAGESAGGMRDATYSLAQPVAVKPSAE